MRHPNPTDGEARRTQIGVVDLQLARVGEPGPSDNMFDRSRSICVIKRKPAEVGSWDYISPPRAPSTPGGHNFSQMNMPDRRLQENSQEQHLHLHQLRNFDLWREWPNWDIRNSREKRVKNSIKRPRKQCRKYESRQRNDSEKQLQLPATSSHRTQMKSFREEMPRRLNLWTRRNKGINSCNNSLHKLSLP